MCIIQVLYIPMYLLCILLRVAFGKVIFADRLVQLRLVRFRVT